MAPDSAWLAWLGGTRRKDAYSFLTRGKRAEKHPQARSGVMRKVQRRHRDFWVGTLKRHNSAELGLVVYDPLARAATGNEYVVLFEVAESVAGDFRKEVVRELIGSVDGISNGAIESAVDAYCGFARIDPEAEWRCAKAAQHAIVDAHRRFLAGRGLPPARTRSPSGHRHRVTHCYSCKCPLDNAIDVEGEGCSWIVCRCGACGCGYGGIGAQAT
jgi:hypothetical protein